MGSGAWRVAGAGCSGRSQSLTEVAAMIAGKPRPTRYFRRPHRRLAGPITTVHDVAGTALMPSPVVLSADLPLAAVACPVLAQRMIVDGRRHLTLSAPSPRR